MGAADLEDLFRRVPAIERHIAELHGKLVAQGAPALIAYNTPARALLVGATQKYLVSHSHNESLRVLRASVDTNRAAFLRTTGGQGAGAFLEVPLDDRWVMSNTGFKTACRRRLGMCHPGHAAIPLAHLCQNMTRQGRVCGTACDEYGMHLECCAPGGGVVGGHDDVSRCLVVLAARGLDSKAKLEQMFQSWPGQSEGRLVKRGWILLPMMVWNVCLLMLSSSRPMQEMPASEALVLEGMGLHHGGRLLQKELVTCPTIWCRLRWKLVGVLATRQRPSYLGWRVLLTIALWSCSIFTELCQALCRKVLPNSLRAHSG